MYKRVFVIVMDSVGCGYESNSYKYGDEGANTLAHIAENTNGLNLKTLETLGLGNIIDIKGVNKLNNPKASYGKLKELSNGKDTLTGHWEIMGIETKTPFKTFTDKGFPKELIKKLEKETGHKVIGNYAASGTEILKVLGEEQIKTNSMIVYTSSDSVLQIAAHEKYFGLDELYRCCKIARELCMDPKYLVGRIIARPYIGEDSSTFKRTANRHDYALSPTGKTVLDSLKENNYDVISVGKINDIFNTKGITKAFKSVSNDNGMDITIDIAKSEFKGLCFVNLVDFDALYGHRRDVVGYKKALEDFDNKLKLLLDELNSDDLLIITADHGNDPTWSGTDHTREYVPLIAYSKNKVGVNLGERQTFADIGATIAENFEVEMPKIGISFLGELK